jgi:hypothetical protein
MDLNIFGHTKDLRTNTFVVYAHISIDDYLVMVGSNFDDFPVQRRQEKHKAYQRMRRDILEGAVLPPITLAVKPDVADNLKNLIETENWESVKSELSKPNQLFILDGLQRTHILNDLKNENNSFKVGQKLLVEFWIEKDIKHLIYRLIILNSGQKTMSLRHQLDLLFMPISDEIKRDIPDIELLKERDEQRRRKAKCYSFETITTTYYCFLTKNYEPNKENLITQQLQEESVTNADENEMSEKLELFKPYLKVYSDLDELTYAHYSQINTTDRNAIHWFAKENVMNSFFAALSDYGNNNLERKERIMQAMKNLKESFKFKQDPLGLSKFDEIRSKTFDASKKNIGLATKRLLFDGFKEFFKNEGEKSFEDCWTFSAP